MQHDGGVYRRDHSTGQRFLLPSDWPGVEAWKAGGADLQEQFADLVFALGGGFM